jgi:hypothetical protein
MFYIIGVFIIHKNRETLIYQVNDESSTPLWFELFLMPGNSTWRIAVSIKVVKCREEADKRYSILREIFQKNDCAYLTKMKGGDDA